MGFIKTIRQRQQYLNHISVGVKFKFLSFLGLTCHDCAKNYEKGFETCLYAPSSNKDILIFHKSRAFKFNTLSGTYALSLILKLAKKTCFLALPVQYRNFWFWFHTNDINFSQYLEIEAKKSSNQPNNTNFESTSGLKNHFRFHNYPDFDRIVFE